MKRTRQQRKMSNRPHALRRGGFTLIELMVVVAIIATLVGIIVPAVSSARASARNAQCLNNIRNVGLAINNLATSNNGKYPYLSTTGDPNSGWPIRILERFDNAALAREIRGGGTARPYVDGFTCPDDLDSHNQDGGLSYVVNVGYVSSQLWGNVNDQTHDTNQIIWRDGSSDAAQNAAISYATGVVWRPEATPSTSFRSTIDSVTRGDGATQTILLSENVNAGPWSATGTGEIGFGLWVNFTTSVTQIGGANTKETALQLRSSFQAGDSAINSKLDSSTIGTAWRPGSFHSGYANFAFCDGHTKSISEAIDKFVYARLLSSAGQSHGQAVVDGSSY